MKVAAVIAEYNPFHTGHRYHLASTREQTGADYILVIMSGDFVQRGAPALLNKYIRTRMALNGGADVVLELPTLYATSSAEYFAQSAVILMNGLGAVDILSFGSEAGSTAPLMDAASTLLSAEEQYRPALCQLLKEGLSYPIARERILKEYLPPFHGASADLLGLPNNILGVEYCKALLACQSNIVPFTLARKGKSFHDVDLCNDSDTFVSAEAIRDLVKRCYTKSTSEDDSDRMLSHIQNYIPEESRALFEDSVRTGAFLTEDDLSLLLHHKLLSAQETGFFEYLDCTPDLSDKIIKYLSEYTGYTDFCALLKSKDITYSRLSRMLLHILLDMKTPAFYRNPYGERNYFLPYVRLLGFRESASPLLSSIKKNSSIPLIAKLADAKNNLTGDALTFLNREIFYASLYEAVSASKANTLPAGVLTGATCRTREKTALNEFRQSPIVIP